VSLLKPLQDAVVVGEEEKNAIQRVLRDLEKDRQSSQDELSQQTVRIDTLQSQVSALQEQLKEEKQLASARESLLKAQAHHNTPGSFTSDSTLNQSNDDTSDSLSNIKRAREELRRKRETEGNLQKLMKDAQSRFNSLHDQNEDISARNRELEGQIRKLGAAENEPSDGEIGSRAQLTDTIAQQDEEIRRLRLEMERMQKTAPNHPPGENMPSQKMISSLEEELAFARNDLGQQEQANKVLNKSLKEALGLLKPLQTHLEAAETEKIEISKELRNLRKRFRQLQMGEMVDDQSRSTVGGYESNLEISKIKEELEETIRQLELENSELHNALEDLTEDGRQHNNEAKMRQRLVELNSQYEVTQNKLEDAHVENHILVKALKQKEMEETKRRSGMIQLEERLHKTESELINAKKIAQSALVKVEELTMSNIEQLSISRDATTVNGNNNARSPGRNEKYSGEAYYF